MSFRIDWLPSAMSRLAAEWDTLAWDGKKQITDALDRMDALLSSTPMAVGESRDTAALRLLIEPPIVVRYFVDETDSSVVILGVSIRREVT